MKHVLLLRAPAENGLDRYETALRDKGYLPLSVPVLETALVHVDDLRDRIVAGPDALSGVIVTSKRAIEAWSEAVRSIQTSQDWRAVPFYVVGEATAAAASDVAPENQVRGGAETGTAERLAAFILAKGVRGRRMLYLTGDKNRDTLPTMLSAGGVALDALEVYRTTGSSTFRDDLRAALDEVPAGGDWGWVVYFAPSAAGFVTPTLGEVLPLDALKVAAIGPTTASFLRDTLGMRVDAVAPKPTPDALCNAIAAVDDAPLG